MLIFFTCVPFQISGRLFSDSVPRQSTQLSGEAKGNNTSATTSTVNGASSTEYLGNSRLSTAGFCSVTIPKGLAWASECFDGGNILVSIVLYQSPF